MAMLMTLFRYSRNFNWHCLLQNILNTPFKSLFDACNRICNTSASRRGRFRIRLANYVNLWLGDPKEQHQDVKRIYNTGVNQIREFLKFPGCVLSFRGLLRLLMVHHKKSFVYQLTACRNLKYNMQVLFSFTCCLYYVHV